MQILKLPVNNPNDLRLPTAFGTGAKIRWESSPDNVTFTELSPGTTDILENVRFYTFVDPDGTTTTYYRTRYSTASPSVADDYSEYSPAFRPGAFVAYATLDDLREALPDSPTESKDNYLYDLLIRASDIITRRCGRDFYRHPSVSGTEARIVRAAAGERLIVLDGISSLTTVEYASEFGGSWTPLGAENTDWYLDDPVDGTYFSVRLPDNGALTSWYTGPRRVRLTGVFGWATVPTIIEAGTVALAREMYVMQPTGRGSASGAAGLGSIAVPELLPRPTYEAINWGSRLVGHLFT